jgi:hypothetical protein
MTSSTASTLNHAYRMIIQSLLLFKYGPANLQTMIMKCIDALLVDEELFTVTEGAKLDLYGLLDKIENRVAPAVIYSNVV